MEVVPTSIEGLSLVKIKIHNDDRGYFCETFRQEFFLEKFKKIQFIQDNEAKSEYGILRGLHFQYPPFEQSKLVRVIEGEVLDVAIDLRPGSSSFGKYELFHLSAENKDQLFIPRGFAHGYLTLSEYSIFSYKVDNSYSKEHEGGLHYLDKTLSIPWHKYCQEIKLSTKDNEINTTITDYIDQIKKFNS